MSSPLHSPAAPEQAPGSDGAHARAEVALASGLNVAIEVSGTAAASRLASKALGAAAREIENELHTQRKNAPVEESFCGLYGVSPQMRELFQMLNRIRNTHATVLITGANGTGKELVARAIHQLSPRADKPFVAANCSAFNDNLLESELFGHKRGAFTGAVGDKRGLFEVADGGTFFMDEVGDMSPALQVKLLRVLQEGTFMPVGGTEGRKVDVRAVAATNRDLTAMVAQGTFREDLFYRLNVVGLRVPALRERRSDIPLLARCFLDQLAQRTGRRVVLSQAALGRLVAHDWPGNVRELENEIERLWVLAGDSPVVDVEHLSPSIGRKTAGLAASEEGEAVAGSIDAVVSLPTAVEQLERTLIVNAIGRSKGNKTRAADELGISRRNLIRKLQAYRLETEVDPTEPEE